MDLYKGKTREELIGIIIERDKEIERINVISRAHERDSIRDHLTGLYNRRFMEAEVNRLSRIVCDGNGLNIDFDVFFIDADKLSKVNNQLGHPEGDRLLVLIANCLLRAFRRAGDVVCRWGGDEFVVLCKHDRHEHRDMCELFEAYVAEAITGQFLLADYQTGASIGMAQGSICNSLDFLRLITQADENMYSRKNRLTS